MMTTTTSDDTFDLPELAVARTTALLRARVPLALLMDLAAPFGPRSQELYGQEPADSMSWLLVRAG